MRAHQILLEYSRDITANKYGDKIIAAFQFPRIVFTNTPFANIRDADWILDNRDDVISLILDYIESKDPTPNKKYTQWLVRSWVNSGDNGVEYATRLENLNRNNLLAAYEIGKNKNKIELEHRDINKFKSWTAFEHTILTNYDIREFINTEEPKNRGKYSELDFPDVRIVVPKDVAAACYYGRGTRWCTAATEGSNYFDVYNRQGPLYIMLPKTPQYPGEKYQIHPDSHQFMNEEDEPVDILEFFTQRWDKSTEKFLIGLVPSVKRSFALLPKSIVVAAWKAAISIIVKNLDKYYAANNIMAIKEALLKMSEYYNYDNIMNAGEAWAINITDGAFPTLADLGSIIYFAVEGDIILHDDKQTFLDFAQSVGAVSDNSPVANSLNNKVNIPGFVVGSGYDYKQDDI
jgi:hypothetical protein